MQNRMEIQRPIRDTLCVMRYAKEKDSAFLFLITHNGVQEARSRIT